MSQQNKSRGRYAARDCVHKNGYSRGVQLDCRRPSNQSNRTLTNHVDDEVMILSLIFEY